MIIQIYFKANQKHLTHVKLYIRTIRYQHWVALAFEEYFERFTFETHTQAQTEQVRVTRVVIRENTYKTTIGAKEM